MAVELRNWIEGELEVNLPIVELMRSPSLAGLAELLAEQLATHGETRTPESGGNGVAKAQTNGHVALALDVPPDELLARVEDLSGEEVDALLSVLLNKKGCDGEESGEPGIVGRSRLIPGGLKGRRNTAQGEPWVAVRP
jgi:hypothetical protein